MMLRAPRLRLNPRHNPGSIQWDEWDGVSLRGRVGDPENWVKRFKIGDLEFRGGLDLKVTMRSSQDRTSNEPVLAEILIEPRGYGGEYGRSLDLSKANFNDNGGWEWIPERRWADMPAEFRYRTYHPTMEDAKRDIEAAIAKVYVSG